MMRWAKTLDFLPPTYLGRPYFAYRLGAVAVLAAKNEAQPLLLARQ